MSQKRKRILKLLEEGQITSDEADRLLADSEEEEAEKKRKNNAGEGYTQERFKQDVRSFTEGVKNFLDDTFQRIKDGPFEFNFQQMDIHRKYTFPVSEVNHLDFDLFNTTLEFLPIGSSEIVIDCKAKVYKENDQQKAEEYFERHANIGLVEDTLRFETNNKNIQTKLVIYLPKKKYDKVSFKAMNGSMKFLSTHFEQASISTVNGNVTMDQYTGGALYVETKHGSIKLDDAEFNKAKLAATTGSVYVDGSMEDLDIYVVTGSVRNYIRNQQAKSLAVEAMTGSIQVYMPGDVPMIGSANTSIGNVDIQLKDVLKTNMDEHLMKKQVQFHNTDGEGEYFDIDLSTKTGSIKVNPIIDKKEND
uniref:DUF4097 family beta strand repeat-containing protein n=1 Tax=uncultured Allobacillus sp. TaxID=1638025 RepID=UPI002591A2B6|nr:DUF4097 family beta strand repeat-containing protein [uncultured Allobacillus sp.]